MLVENRTTLALSRSQLGPIGAGAKGWQASAPQEQRAPLGTTYLCIMAWRSRSVAALGAWSCVAMVVQCRGRRGGRRAGGAGGGAAVGPGETASSIDSVGTALSDLELCRW